MQPNTPVEIIATANGWIVREAYGAHNQGMAINHDDCYVFTEFDEMVEFLRHHMPVKSQGLDLFEADRAINGAGSILKHTDMLDAMAYAMSGPKPPMIFVDPAREIADEVDKAVLGQISGLSVHTSPLLKDGEVVIVDQEKFSEITKQVIHRFKGAN